MIVQVYLISEMTGKFKGCVTGDAGAVCETVIQVHCGCSHRYLEG